MNTDENLVVMNTCSADHKFRMFAVWCVRRIQHLIKNKESLNALEVAERFSKYQATTSELSKAFNEALSAEPNEWWTCRADSAARQTAHFSASDAAYYAANTAAYAYADSVADQVTQPKEWEAALIKEQSVQSKMLKKIIWEELGSLK